MLDTVELLYTDAELDQMSENGARSPPPSSSFYRAIRSICACPATAPSAWFSRYCSAFQVESPLCSTSKARAQSCAPRRISFCFAHAGIGGYPFGYAGREECRVEISKKQELFSSSCFFASLVGRALRARYRNLCKIPDLLIYCIPLFLVGQRRRVLIELRHIYDVIPHKAMRLAGGRHDFVPRFFLHARVLGENLQFHPVAELANHRRVGQRLFADVCGAVRRRLPMTSRSRKSSAAAAVEAPGARRARALVQRHHVIAQITDLLAVLRLRFIPDALPFCPSSARKC